MNLKDKRVIQGGMGMGISGWPLVEAVCKCGPEFLGTLSGVALERMLARQLQKGDPGGYLKVALSAFPFPETSRLVWEHYYVPGGIGESKAYKAVPKWQVESDDLLISLSICANFVYVWLSKQNHNNLVSINYLEKMQIPHLYSIYGAMLAGVDIITMGAGIPEQIPGVLEAFSAGKPAQYRLYIEGEPKEHHTYVCFDPAKFFQRELPCMNKPDFLPVVSSVVLAKHLLEKSTGYINGISGFVIEGPLAGGHNASPRGKLQLNADGEPIYGPRDEVRFDKIVELGLPFWIGGGKASSQALSQALECGASGIQVGTIFALCKESCMVPELAGRIRSLARKGKLKIRVNPVASPTGFPFRVACLEGTVTDPSIYDMRNRICDQQCLPHLYWTDKNDVGYRCPAGPVMRYIDCGGNPDDTIGKICLCNGLLATAGLGTPGEPYLVTLGEDTSFLSHLPESYTAADAAKYLLGE